MGEEEEDTEEKSEIDSEKITSGQEDKVEDNILSPETEGTTLNLDKEGVIKAPKVELEGIKVMGKINLPKPKNTEDPEVVAPEKVLDATTDNEDSKEEGIVVETLNIVP